MKVTEPNAQSLECERLIWDRDMRILENWNRSLLEMENSTSTGSTLDPNLNLSSMCFLKDFQVRLIFCRLACLVLVSGHFVRVYNEILGSKMNTLRTDF